MTFEERIQRRKAELEAEDRARKSMPLPSPVEKARERRERAELSRQTTEWIARMGRVLEGKR